MKETKRATAVLDTVFFSLHNVDPYVICKTWSHTNIRIVRQNVRNIISFHFPLSVVLIEASF